jgi:hypothetical protein
VNTLLSKAMTGILCLIATTLGAETLAMTVKYDQGDVGLGHQTWTTHYFTDDQDRIVRKIRSVKGEFVGDPDTNYETVYRWENGTVIWVDERFDGVKLTKRLTPENDGLALSVTALSGDRPERAEERRQLRFLDDQETAWTNGTRVFKWSSQGGYSEQSADASEEDPQARSGWTTNGASLTEWFRGNENNRVILDRRPDKLQGTFVQPNENLTGWNVTGELEVVGRGLWNKNSLIRLAHMAILDDGWDLAWSAPLVWTKGYLR